MTLLYQVLIVDDKDIVRRELKRLKIWGEASGFILVAEAGNGQEALDFIAQNPVDLIITDIKMPKIDGLELLQSVVENKLCSCVVLLSDYSEFSFARQGIVLGAFDYVPKPVNEVELTGLLKRAKKYLDSENCERERVRKLEELSTEIKELHMSLLDSGKLMELIKSGDLDTLGYLEQLLDRMEEGVQVTHALLENNMKSVMQELMAEIKRTCPWIEQFIDIADIQAFRILPDQDFTAMKILFLDKIKRLMNLLNILKYNINDKGIEGQVCGYVLSHVDNDISLAAVAGSLYMNKTYISEVFKQKMGIAFTEYVTGVKMERAKLLIRKENRKSFEIAEQLGFRDAEYFSKVFKKSVGLTPTEYRRKYEASE